MCRMMVSILALSLCGGITVLPNQAKPRWSTPEGRAEGEWIEGDPSFSSNWSLRLKTVELDPEKGVKAVSAVLHNQSRESVGVNISIMRSCLRYGLRLWTREASGAYRMRLNPRVCVNPSREITTIHSGQEVDISWQMRTIPNDPIPDKYQLVYSSRYHTSAAECSPASLNPGLFVVDGVIELEVHEVKKDGTSGKRLGVVVLHTDNKLWVDLRESE